MKTVVDPPLGLDGAAARQQLMRSGTAIFEVLGSTARNIQLIQAKAGAEMFTRSLDSLVAAFSPGGAQYWSQQLPLLYRMQATSVVKSAADTVSELLQTQQALMSMGTPSSLQSVQETVDATTQAMRKLYSRRVSSQVIQFPERRAA